MSHQGFCAFLIDRPAQGDGAGHRTTFGKRKAIDAAAALRSVRGCSAGPRIGANGISLDGDALVLGTEPLSAGGHFQSRDIRISMRR